MKNIFLAILFAVFSLNVNAQVKIPRPSPKSTIKQIVGLTHVEINYSRPGVKGRVIFGELVPYGELWRTGANENTTIEFSTPVIINGKELEKGKYAIYTKPSEKSWEVFFYSKNDSWGKPKKWEANKVIASLTVEVIQMPIKVETFTITIDDLTTDSANLGLMWESTYVGIPIKTPTNKAVLESIKSTIGIGKAKFKDYYSAAVYLSSTNQDLKTAKKYMDKAMALNKKPKFFQLREQSLLLSKVGDKKGAIEVAKKALEGAQKAGNKDHIRLNTDSLKEWGGI